MHQAALDAVGIDARFEVWEVPPSGLRALVDGMRDGDTLGASVTIPHKETIVALMDEVTPKAAGIGAVNCVAVRDGRLIGHNTDGDGFIRALRESAGFDPTDRRALLLGAGGAARALAHALVSEGVESLVIANRTVRRARALAKEVGGDAIAVGFDPEDLARPASNADLIVNATSVGMSSSNQADASPLPGALIPAGALVNDIVYSPPETPLLRVARRRGARTLGGLPMLVYQGAVAFELWTGVAAPVDAMFAAAEAALPVKASEGSKS